MESFAPDEATFSNFQIGVSSLERDLDGVIFEFPSPDSTLIVLAIS
jgi:hypothetical protein